MTQTERILQQVTDNHIDNSPNEFTGINTGHDSYCSIPFVKESMQICSTQFAEWVTKRAYIYTKQHSMHTHPVYCMYGDTRFFDINELFKIWEEQ